MLAHKACPVAARYQRWCVVQLAGWGRVSILEGSSRRVVELTGIPVFKHYHHKWWTYELIVDTIHKAKNNFKIENIKGLAHEDGLID